MQCSATDRPSAWVGRSVASVCLSVCLSVSPSRRYTGNLSFSRVDQVFVRFSCALGVLNDYALYKSTHSLTHLLTPARWNFAGVQGRQKVEGFLGRCTWAGFVPDIYSLKFYCRRTACVEQFTGYYKTDHQLRTV